MRGRIQSYRKGSMELK